MATRTGGSTPSFLITKDATAFNGGSVVIGVTAIQNTDRFHQLGMGTFTAIRVARRNGATLNTTATSHTLQINNVNDPNDLGCFFSGLVLM
jgi:hypothetical protein